jgi:MYXO-CTERM domain-containing protein
MLLPRLLGAVAAVCLAQPAIAQTRPNVEALSVQAPANGVSGRQVRLRIEVDAHGASSFRWAAYLSPSGTLQGSLQMGSFGPVAASASGTTQLEQDVTLPASAQGSYSVLIALDPANAVAESNEYDNVAVSADRLRIRAPAADLRVVAVRPLAPALRAGAPIAIEIDLANDGELDASTEVSAHLSADEAVSTRDEEIGRASVSVTAGGTTTVRTEAALPAVLREGDYVVGAIVDPALSLAEIDEIDNLGLAADRLNVFADTLELLTPDLPGGTVFIPYFARLEARGGDGTYRFAVARGRLPAGLSIAADTGEITGTPLESGAIQLDIEVRSAALVDVATFSIEVRESGVELEIVTLALETGTLGLPYQDRLGAAGGEPPYSWRLLSGAIPPGLDLASDGWLRGLPNQEGHFSFIAEVGDARGARVVGQFAIEIEAPNVAILSGTLPPAPVGVPATIQLQITGGTPPYDWKGLSAPPPGLTLSESGVLSGTPSTVGRFAMRIRVTDSSRRPRTDTAIVHLMVEDAGELTILTTSLPRLEIREQLNVTLEAQGGTAPFEWRLAKGSVLPDGFVLEQDEMGARIRGRSIRPVAAAFTVELEDGMGRERAIDLAIEVARVSKAADSGCRCTSLGDASASTGLLLLAGLTALLVRRRQNEA